jgi:hypothetical protein
LAGVPRSATNAGAGINADADADADADARCTMHDARWWTPNRQA